MSSIFSKLKKVRKTIEAPEYFEEIHKETEKMDKMIADKLEISLEQFREYASQPEFNDIMAKYAAEKGWSKGEIYKVKFLLEAANAYIVYAMARFKFENLDNEWGKSDYVFYDEKTNEMVIKWFVPRAKTIKEKIADYREQRATEIIRKIRENAANTPLRFR